MSMTIEYNDPSIRDLKEKEEITPLVSLKRKQVKEARSEFQGVYHSGPQIVYQPFANLKLR
jgi:hypothetical protein